MQRHTIVEPVSKGRTDDQELLEKTSDAASDFRRAVLSDVDWGNAGHATDAKTCNESADIDLADVVKRCDLDHGTDHEDDGEAQERNPATKFVVCVRGKNGAEEATGCEEGDNVLGDVSVSLAGKSSGGQWQSEVDFEALEGEHRAHNTSVISCFGA